MCESGKRKGELQLKKKVISGLVCIHTGKISYCLCFSYSQTVESEKTELIMTDFASSENRDVYVLR